MALSEVHTEADGRVRLRTPPDPETDRESRLFDSTSGDGAGMAAGDGAGMAAGDGATVACRRSWARLLGRIQEVDPLTCPACGH
jgi:hypothetical protein